MTKVSVIIPIYNVEDYLKECIKSVLNQTYTDIEIILVDDGSTDNSNKICQVYKNLDSRIILIEKLNGGLSDARNYGMLYATGDYVTFIDSDDYIADNYIEELVVNLKRTNSDIAISGFCNKENDILKNDNTSRDIHIYKKEEALNNMYISKTSIPFSVAWGKLVPREWYKEIIFPVGKLHEDEYTTYKLYLRSKKIVFIDYPMYIYRLRSNSIMNSKPTVKNLYVLDAFKERIELLENYSIDIQRNLVSYYRYIYLFKNCLDKQELTESAEYLSNHLNYVRRKLKGIKIENYIRLFIFKFLGKYYFRNKY